MMTRIDFDGIDFDWFAHDLNGDTAIVCTAGSGYIPDIVVDNAEAHSSISAMIDSPNMGTPMVWQDYANSGLWVYDWGDYRSDGPYRLMSKPIGLMPINLQAALSRIPNIPTLHLRFAECQYLNLDNMVAQPETAGGR